MFLSIQQTLETYFISMSWEIKQQILTFHIPNLSNMISAISSHFDCLTDQTNRYMHMYGRPCCYPHPSATHLMA